MEKLLVRLARQLDAIDEASLMALWSRYATAASRFEPTQRWEEAALVFSLIQAKRWKNQLFNYHWSRQTRGDAALSSPQANPMPDFTLDSPAEATPAARCRVLEFRPAKTEVSPEKQP